MDSRKKNQKLNWESSFSRAFPFPGEKYRPINPFASHFYNCTLSFSTHAIDFSLSSVLLANIFVKHKKVKPSSELYNTLYYGETLDICKSFKRNEN